MLGPKGDHDEALSRGQWASACLFLGSLLLCVLRALRGDILSHYNLLSLCETVQCRMFPLFGAGPSATSDPTFFAIESNKDLTWVGALYIDIKDLYFFLGLLANPSFLGQGPFSITKRRPLCPLR